MHGLLVSYDWIFFHEHTKSILQIYKKYPEVNEKVLKIIPVDIKSFCIFCHLLVEIEINLFSL